jgi:hypothetical protein
MNAEERAIVLAYLEAYDAVIDLPADADYDVTTAALNRFREAALDTAKWAAALRGLLDALAAAEKRVAALESALNLAQSALAAIANYRWPGISSTGLGTCADWLLNQGHNRSYVELFFDGTEWKPLACLRYEVAEEADRLVTEARRTLKGTDDETHGER